MTKSQQERLGVRLIASATPTDADLDSLHELLTFYGAILEATSERIRSVLDLRTTSRVKNTGTILEKLRRSGGATLKSMQDLAGMRIVGGPDRREQDETVERVAALFRDEVREPKVIDRRVNPVHGYSAVHVIVYPEGVPVEVQIRTTWQHEWAEVFEKLADAVGRGIRYGEAPERLQLPLLPARRFSPLHFNRMKRSANADFKSKMSDEFGRRISVVELALDHAEFIRGWEEAVSSTPSQVELSKALDALSPDLDGLRRQIDLLHQSQTHIDELKRRLLALGARADT